MKIASEAKIGITAILTIAVIIWGINYLKGVNILSSTYSLSATYDAVDGLEPSANVMMDGFKVGTVEKIVFETEALPPFTVYMEIDKSYPIRQGSTAEIHSADLLGSKAIKIISSDSETYVSDGDLLLSQRSADMFTTLLEDITPLLNNFSAAALTLDSAGMAIRKLIDDPAISQMVGNLEQASGSLSEQLSSSGDLTKTLENIGQFSKGLNAKTGSLQSTITHLEEITGELKNAHLDSLVMNLNLLSSSISNITNSIENGKGTAGKLITEDSLYQQLDQLITDLDSLITDVNKNPKKYVSFSLIGK